MSGIDPAVLRARRRDHGAATYVCPDCKTQLVDLRCAHCAHQYKLLHGFPALISNDQRYRSAREVVDAYDSIYAHYRDAWENQGRSREFIAYLAALLSRFRARRVLEVGCGEGALLAALTAGERYGTDLSTRALERAHASASAGLCIALGERLPFSDGFFDTVASVRVMGHFLDDQAACAEIFRVLREGGRYIAAIHLHLTPWESVRQKVAEYIYPNPRPLLFASWLFRNFYRPIQHPIQNRYTLADAKARLEQGGFEIAEIIHQGNTPAAPLAGPHVVVFICQKPAETAPPADATRLPSPSS